MKARWSKAFHPPPPPPLVQPSPTWHFGTKSIELVTVTGAISAGAIYGWLTGFAGHTSNPWKGSKTHIETQMR
jgi:hypothetical protein